MLSRSIFKIIPKALWKNLLIFKYIKKSRKSLGQWCKHLRFNLVIRFLLFPTNEPTDRQTKVACCLISVHFLGLYNFTSFFIVCFIAYANYIESKFKCLWTLSNKFSTTERHNETHTFHDIHTMTRTKKKKSQKIQKHKLKNILFYWFVQIFTL